MVAAATISWSCWAVATARSSPRPSIDASADSYGRINERLADVNNDGNLDVVVAVGPHRWRAVATAFSSATARAGSLFNPNTLIRQWRLRQYALTVGDFDGDGKIDILDTR